MEFGSVRLVRTLFWPATLRRRSGFTHSRACLFRTDRKSTRLNSSHLGISYAVFCLKKTRSEEHTSELQSLRHLVCRLLLESKYHMPELLSLWLQARHPLCWFFRLPL